MAVQLWPTATTSSGVSQRIAGKARRLALHTQDDVRQFVEELASIFEHEPIAAFEYGVLDNAKTGEKAYWAHDALQSVKS